MLALNVFVHLLQLAQMHAECLPHHSHSYHTIDIHLFIYLLLWQGLLFIFAPPPPRPPPSLTPPTPPVLLFVYAILILEVTVYSNDGAWIFISQ